MILCFMMPFTIISTFSFLSLVLLFLSLLSLRYPWLDDQE
jgi:hypothetical protein